MRYRSSGATARTASGRSRCWLPRSSSRSRCTTTSYVNPCFLDYGPTNRPRMSVREIDVAQSAYQTSSLRATVPAQNARGRRNDRAHLARGREQAGTTSTAKALAAGWLKCFSRQSSQPRSGRGYARAFTWSQVRWPLATLVGAKRDD